ncbi:MAG: bicyclomycin/multidrug efflux system [Chloroflexi bacterium ADurb.Bin325]|nr:MAG: bicyclomycin/multidrug efflux system [Chloroflexi bacterium ADurb.Bin325]
MTTAAPSAAYDETAYHEFVERHYRRNLIANVLDLGLFTAALNLVSLATIMPLLISRLTDSKIIIGLLPALANVGYLLPQLLTANYTEGLRRKLPFTAACGMAERLPYPLIGLATWFLALPAPGLALPLILSLRAGGAVAGGLSTPAWYDLIAKVIPLRRRGFYSSVGNGLGAILGVAGAALAGWILGHWPYPQNFAICFFAAFGLMMASLAVFFLNREPDSPSVKQRAALGVYLRQLPQVLRRDHNYLHYLISRATVLLGGMAAGFYMVYGVEQFGLAERHAGTLTALLVGSQALAGLAWGHLGDRAGHKIVLVGEAVFAALAASIALIAPSAIWLGVTFILVGVASSASSVSAMNIILEFCPAEDRPTYIGLTNTLLAPFVALGPVLGGALATWLGYRPMFVAAIAVALVGGLLMAAWVREPRRNRNGWAQPA